MQENMVTLLEESLKKILDYPEAQVIESLTVNAGSIMRGEGLIDATASEFVNYIFAKILRATVEEHRLHLLYLCDSIMKNVPQYVAIFKKRLPTIFVDTWKNTTGFRKQKLYDLLVTWEQMDAMISEMNPMVAAIRQELYRIGEFAHAGRLTPPVAVESSTAPSSLPDRHKDTDGVHEHEHLEVDDHVIASSIAVKAVAEDKDSDSHAQNNGAATNPIANNLTVSRAEKLAPRRFNGRDNSSLLSAQNQSSALFSEDRFLMILDEEARSILKISQANFPEDQHFSLDMLEQQPQLYHDLFKKALINVTARGVYCENEKLVYNEQRSKSGMEEEDVVQLVVGDVIFPGLHSKSLSIYHTLDRVCREIKMGKPENELEPPQKQPAKKTKRPRTE